MPTQRQMCFWHWKLYLWQAKFSGFRLQVASFAKDKRTEFPKFPGLLFTSWWFPPIWKILVKLDHFSQVGEIKNIWNHHQVHFCCHSFWRPRFFLQQKMHLGRIGIKVSRCFRAALTAAHGVNRLDFTLKLKDSSWGRSLPTQTLCHQKMKGKKSL